MKRSHLKYFILTLLFTSCSQSPSYQADGYIEGDYTYIATSVSGELQKLMVDKGKYVKKGDPLFSLDLEPESDVYTAVAENLKQAIKANDALLANLEYARLTYERYKVLVPKKAIQQSQLDNAKSTYDATLAEVAKGNASIASASASLAEAKWRVQQKNVTAPVDGLVFDTYYRVGEYTTADKPILSILAPQDIKVIFYVNATNLSALQLGDSVTVRSGNNAPEMNAIISYISPIAEYTPPVIYSTETNEKLIFRIEADFKKEDAEKLHPGMPATVKYHAHAK